MIATKSTLFTTGRIVATPGALQELEIAGQDVLELLSRHLRGDWGVLDADDKAANDEAVVEGSRILSAYKLKTGEKIWIITEATDDHGHRAATTLLLPNEY